MYSTILQYILSIISSITSIWANKAKNTDLTDNELAKKIKKDEDEYQKLLDRAMNGDKEALDEIRKRIS